jgi:ubiquitin-protein ligase
MGLTDQAIKSVVPDASLTLLTAALKGKTRSNGGLNVVDLKHILHLCNPAAVKPSKRADIVACLKVHVDGLSVVAPSLLPPPLQVPRVPKEPKLKLYFPVKNTYEHTSEQCDEYLAGMYDIVFSTSPDIHTPADCAQSFTQTAKVMKHLRLLRTELLDSLHVDSCIIFVQSEQHMACSQFMITGPRDTPYDNGLFHFQMNLPSTYPNVSPKVTMLNTGGGRYRANPNIYASGKVCLNLLGTWGENVWKASSSNLCQVLIAIQGQILNEYPLRNEPGYEKSSNNDIDLYNAVIRIYTIKLGMTEMMRHPPIGFEAAIACYFTGPKKLEIAEQLLTWIAAAKSITLEAMTGRSGYITGESFVGAQYNNSGLRTQIIATTIEAATELLELFDLPEYIAKL